MPPRTSEPDAWYRGPRWANTLADRPAHRHRPNGSPCDPRAGRSSHLTGPMGSLSGVGSMGCLFWLVVLGAGGYAGYHLLGPHVQAWRFKDAMQVQADNARVNSNEKIRASLMQTASELHLPLEPRELKIQREGSNIVIWASWSREVVLPKYRRILHFHRSVTAPVASQPP